MKIYNINWKHARTEHGEDYFRSGVLGYDGGKPIKLAILPRLEEEDQWRLVLQAKDYETSIDDEAITLEACFTCALEWYQSFKRSDAHLAA